LLIGLVGSGTIGVWAAYLVFELPITHTSTMMHRTEIPKWWSEGIATFRLLFVIFGGLISRSEVVPSFVAIDITRVN
jgi:hypothetical protein|tara:strand:- start:179 stop:409 length:231 start_codon:yes stop_codon:yes gene_type:complete